LIFLGIVALAAAVPVSHAPAPISKQAEGFDKCSLCQELVTIAASALQNNQTIAEITTAVQDLCTAIGNSPLSYLKPECDALVSFVPQIVAWIVDEVPADQICQLIGFCSSSSAPASAKYAATFKDLNTDECATCQMLVGLVESELSQNSTEEKIQQVINELCDTLANSSLSILEPECRLFASNIDTVIQLLLTKETPLAVCTQIQLCNSSQSHVERVLTKQDVNLDDCTFCEELVTLGENALAQNKTADEIRTLILDLCAEIEKTPLKVVSKECHFVADHVDEIVQLLLAQANPKEVCSVLGMCTSKTAVISPLLHAQRFGVDKCEICEELLNLVEFELQQNTTEAKIQTLVDDACAELQKTPLSGLYPECELVAQNVPQAIAALLNLETPQTACSQLKLC